MSLRYPVRDGTGTLLTPVPHIHLCTSERDTGPSQSSSRSCVVDVLGPRLQEYTVIKYSMTSVCTSVCLFVSVARVRDPPPV